MTHFLPRAVRRLNRAIGRTVISSRQSLRDVLGEVRLVAADIGAAAGLPQHWAPLREVAYFYLFEPHSESAAELRVLFSDLIRPELLQILPLALSGTGGPRTFHLTNVPTGSSLLPVNTEDAYAGALRYAPREYFTPVREIDVETVTLDAALEERNEPELHLIKLDVQGAELEILQGLGRERWKKVLAIETEIGIARAYREQPGLSKMEGFLQEQGLELFDLRLAHVHCILDNDPTGYQRRIFGVAPDEPSLRARLHEVDAIYFRRPTSLLEARDRDNLRRLIALYALYSYFVEAYDLVSVCAKSKIFSALEATELQTSLKHWHRARKSRFLD